MTYDEAREKAGELVAKRARYNTDTPNDDRRYVICYRSRYYFAGDTAKLADTLAEVMQKETP